MSLVGASPAVADHGERGSQFTVAPAGDTSCGSNTPYHTIQSAVTAAAAGDHILVCPATYREHVVIDNSGHSRDNLDLEGADPRNTFIQFPTTSTSPDAIVLVNGTKNVQIHRLTIEGPWNDADLLGCAQPTHFGIFVEGGGSASIYTNHVTMIQDANQAVLGGCQDGLAVRIGSFFSGQTGSGQVKNNLIDNYQKNGVTIDGTGTSAVVSGNAIVGDTVDPNGVNPFIARNGVQFGRGATGSVLDNSISKNEYGGAGPPPAAEDPDSSDAAGILAFELTGHVQIGGNFVTLNDIGLDFGFGPSGTEEAGFGPTTGLSIRDNVATTNRFNGLRGEIDTMQNTLADNRADGTLTGGYDCRDDSVGGSTAGTANTWSHDQGQTAKPPGICKPRSRG
jgi:hypothetical protein